VKWEYPKKPEIEFSITTYQAHHGGFRRELTGCSFPIQLRGTLPPIGPLTHCGQSLLAVITLSTGNLERRHNAIAHFNLLDARTHTNDNTTELMAEDVTFLELRDGP
jgi:hypothetical protein